MTVTREMRQVALGLVTRGLSRERAIAAALATKQRWASDTDRVAATMRLIGEIDARARSQALEAARTRVTGPLPTLAPLRPPPVRIPGRVPAVVDPPAVRALMDAPRRAIGRDRPSRIQPWAILWAMRACLRAIGREVFDELEAEAARQRVALRDQIRRKKGWKITHR